MTDVSKDAGGRDRLLAAATRLFSQSGHAGTSVATICAEAGVGRELPEMQQLSDLVIGLLQNALVRYAIDPDEERLDHNLEELQRALITLVGMRLNASSDPPPGP